MFSTGLLQTSPENCVRLVPREANGAWYGGRAVVFVRMDVTAAPVPPANLRRKGVSRYAGAFQPRGDVRVSVRVWQVSAGDFHQMARDLLAIAAPTHTHTQEGYSLNSQGEPYSSDYKLKHSAEN